LSAELLRRHSRLIALRALVILNGGEAGVMDRTWAAGFYVVARNTHGAGSGFGLGFCVSTL